MPNEKAPDENGVENNAPPMEHLTPQQIVREVPPLFLSQEGHRTDRVYTYSGSRGRRLNTILVWIVLLLVALVLIELVTLVAKLLG